MNWERKKEKKKKRVCLSDFSKKLENLGKDIRIYLQRKTYLDQEKRRAEKDRIDGKNISEWFRWNFPKNVIFLLKRLLNFCLKKTKIFKL